MKRDEILVAAANLIVNEGYAACSMRTLAEKVNVKAASLYYHYTSKDHIIREILNAGLLILQTQVQSSLEQQAPDATFQERVRAAIGAHILGMSNEGNVFMQVYEHLPPILKRQSGAMRKQYARLWCSLFQDAVAKGEMDSSVNLELFVPYFLGGLNRVPEWRRSASASVSDVADLAAATLLAGVAGGRNSVYRGSVTSLKTPARKRVR